MDQPMKILVVDDSRMIRQTIRKELEVGGYEVVEAQNGLEGLPSWPIHPPLTW
jgi:two-component system cell cycle response regulator